MSAKATFWAWEQKLEHAPTKLVLLCLADREGKEGGCWPSIRRISEDTSLSETTVHNAIANLVSRGYITKSYRKTRDGDADSNFYSLNITEMSCKQVEIAQGGGTPHAPGVVRGAHQGGTPDGPRVVRHTHPNLKEEPKIESTSRTSLALEGAGGGLKIGTSSDEFYNLNEDGSRSASPVANGSSLWSRKWPNWNSVYAVIVKECGINPAELSKGRLRKQTELAVADIFMINPTLTASETTERVKTYRRENPKWKLTPMALAKWWPTLNNDPKTKPIRMEDM